MVPEEDRQGVRPPHIRQEWLLSASVQIHSQAQHFASVAWASEEKSTGPLGAVGGGGETVLTREVLLLKKHQVSGLPRPESMFPFQGTEPRSLNSILPWLFEQNPYFFGVK